MGGPYTEFPSGRVLSYDEYFEIARGIIDVLEAHDLTVADAECILAEIPDRIKAIVKLKTSNNTR